MTNNQINNVPEGLAQELQAALIQTAEDVGISDIGVSVGVVAPEGTWTGATGISNIDTRQATKPDDLFNIASISKAYTSSVILKLQEQGKLSLDDTIDKWLPEIASHITNGENLTIREILNGSGGLWDYLNGNDEFFSELVADYLSGTNRGWQPEDLIAYAFDKPLFSGGFSTEIWTYTNTGNVIAALIAEKATGKLFKDILAEEILEPLGLDNTFFTTEEVSLEQRARGYEDIFTADGNIGIDGIPEDYSIVNTEIAYGPGSIVSSAEDVSKFFNSLASGELLQPESTAEIFNYVSTGIPGLDRFGLGVFTREYPVGETRSMTGGIFGYTSEVDYFLDSDTTISVLVNEGSVKSELVRLAYKASIANTLGLNDGSVIDGTETDDYLTGTANNDVINGLAGDDILIGKKGLDALDGGEGNDLIKGGRGNDVLFGKEGNDNLYGGEDNDFLNGGEGDDFLEGGRGSDFLIGGNGRDNINGGQDDDLLSGGAGNDIVRDTQGNNVFFGNDGDDLLFAGKEDDALYGDAGNDRLIANAGSDLLLGGSGDDYLNGGAGDDNLLGMEGDDILIGSSGSNILSGGDGSDCFVLSTEGTAIITDFTQGEDFLELPENISFNDLEIIQGSEDNGDNTLINFQTETLAVLNNTNSAHITESDFLLSPQSLFVFNFADNVPQKVRDGMEKAGEIWSSKLANDVTIKINVGFEPSDELNEGASADSNTVEISYRDFRQALINNATSKDDAIAVANLSNSDNFDLSINNTRENQGSDEVYLDNNDSANNSTIELTNANAKALGLAVEEDLDTKITFNSDVNWDFDNSDGVDQNAIDFQGVAIHEIGHVLGFDSGIEALDMLASQNLRELITSDEIELEDIIEFLGLEDVIAELGLEEAIDNVDLGELIAGSPLEPLLENIQADLFISEDEYTLSPMDLFRYSNSSADLGVIDFTTGEKDKYFSLDRGQTEIAQFATGIEGDGGQISHWKSNLGIGIMDPSLTFGEIGTISDTDLQLLDVIGWEIL